VSTPEPPKKKTMESASEDVVRLFNSGDSAGLFALFGPDMQRAVPLEKQRTVREALYQAKGKILASEPVESKERRAVYRLKAERGEWTMRLSVDQSGDRADLNHHVDFPSQRRAADLVQVDASGSSHRGDGKKNNGPLFERSWGVEPVFSGVTVTRGGNTEKISDYTWLKGDRVGEH
jgi:hypothetical protein